MNYLKSLKNFKKFINENKDEDEEVKDWAIFAGIHIGGGAIFQEKFTGTKEQAEMEAWRLACDEYDSYLDLHGIRSIETIMEEEDVNEEEAEEIFRDERESWLDYEVEPYDDKKDYE